MTFNYSGAVFDGVTLSEESNISYALDTEVFLCGVLTWSVEAFA